MKLRIEIDIEPHEAELANELLTTLRALTEHVKVNSSRGQAVPQSKTTGKASPPPKLADSPKSHAQREAPLIAPAIFEAPAQASTPPPPPPTPAASVQPPQSFPAKPAVAPSLPTATANSPAIIPHLTPSRADASSSKQASAELPNGVPNSAPAAHHDQDATDFDALVLSYQQAVGSKDTALQQKAVGDILAALPVELKDGQNKAYSEFVSAFETRLFKKETPPDCSVEQLCQLLAELPSPLKADLRGKIVSTVLRHLMIQRPVASDRNEFLVHAQVFAALVQLQFVLIEGAVQTISKLMREEKTRAASITMLGATAQLCSEQLLTNVDEKKLGALRAALNDVIEPELDYDKSYIEDALHWRPAANGHTGPPHTNEKVETPSGPPPPPQAPPKKGILRLEPQAQWGGYSQTVRGVIVDNEFGQIVSTCNDGSIRLHTADGKELQRSQLASHSFVDLDFNTTTRIIAAAGTDRLSRAHHPIYTLYRLQQGKLELLATKKAPPSANNLLKLRFLAKGSRDYVSAEQAADKTVTIARYTPDVLLESGNDTANPAATYKTDQSLITAIIAVPTSSLAFLTADRSGKIYIWDARSSNPVITLLPPEDSAANASVVTALDTLEPNFVLSGTYGQGINVWDLRALSTQAAAGKKVLPHCANIKLEGGPVTRLVKIPGTERQIVVASATSIQTLQLTETGQLAGIVVGQKADSKFYWDAKWATLNGTKTLYAASAAHPVEGTLDVYRVVCT